MSTAQLQLLFPVPGEWDKLTLTAIHEDVYGYAKSTTYTPDKIPADQAPALAAVVAALVGLAAPWQASQVWAQMADIIATTAYDPEYGPPDTIEAVYLTVEAINDQGGRRTFTAADYPDFVITDAAAVAFFKHFTTTPN